MRRCLVRVFCGACLLLAIAIAVLWWRSYYRASVPGSYRYDKHSWGSVDAERFEIVSYEGFLCARYEKPGKDWTVRPLMVDLWPCTPGWNISVGRDNFCAYARLSFPHWLAIIVLAAPSGGWAVMRFFGNSARRRRAKSLCERCGYDLRASPERCPECGAVRERAGEGVRS